MNQFSGALASVWVPLISVFGSPRLLFIRRQMLMKQDLSLSILLFKNF